MRVFMLVILGSKELLRLGSGDIDAEPSSVLVVEDVCFLDPGSQEPCLYGFVCLMARSKLLMDLLSGPVLPVVGRGGMGTCIS